MNILITGGTGLIGQALVKDLVLRHSVTIITRQQKAQDKDNIKYMSLASFHELENLNEFDAIINLAGSTIACFWSKKNKELILNSRLSITTKLAELIKNSSNPPHTFISGSATGIYPSSSSLVNEESVFIIDKDNFAQKVCKNWEDAALSIHNKTRVCIIRTSIVLSKKGGMLAKILPSFKFGLGAVLGDGSQYFPFIHIEDEIGAIVHLLDTENLHGVFNLAAPNQITNLKFSDELAKVLHRPRYLFVPRWFLKALLKETSNLMLDSQKVEPKALIDSGYKFKYPTIENTLAAIFR